MNIVTVGEVLWDVFDNGQQHIGGAPFNFSAHAKKFGHDVTFVSAVGDDELGRRTLHRIEALRLSTRYVRSTCNAATGTVSVFVGPAGQPTYTIHRPAAYDFPSLSDQELDEIATKQPRWVCFGTLAQLADDVRDVTRRIIGACEGAGRFYDINLRRDSYTPPLIRELLGEATVLKINDEEVLAVARMFGDDPMDLRRFCQTYASRHRLHAICVTRGAKGCFIWLDGKVAEVPGQTVTVADTVGAGDAFAAAFLHGMNEGWTIEHIGDFANRLGALVASRHGAIPDWTHGDLDTLPA